MTFSGTFSGKGALKVFRDVFRNVFREVSPFSPLPDRREKQQTGCPDGPTSGRQDIWTLAHPNAHTYQHHRHLTKISRKLAFKISDFWFFVHRPGASILESTSLIKKLGRYLPSLKQISFVSPIAFESPMTSQSRFQVSHAIPQHTPLLKKNADRCHQQI